MNGTSFQPLIPPYTIHKLVDEELVLAFDCGDGDLNEFITEEAQLYRKALLAETYVVTTEGEQNDIIAFCSVANDRVSLTDFANSTEFNRFRKLRGFPQEKRLRSYPAVKICRLGVDLSHQKLHCGTLLLDFIKSYFTVDNKTGCRFITVDAYIGAIPFYEKNGFRELTTSDEDSQHTRTLYFDLNDVV